ncbi:MAG: CoA transferase [Caulobacteraceae bacterium]|nr:CoA transferase [Caulobacteraceae bacterium]
MARPLAGLRVLDCSLGSAGPQTSGLLADYGAEVIWVEPPGGDPLRREQPAAVSVFDRGKRSITLDVNKAEDRATIARLAERADVFIESWAPGQAQAHGLGHAELRKRNPQLIYCSISGFGEADPRRDLPAYEALVHTLAGSLAVQAGHREPPIFEAHPFAAIGSSYLAAVGILAALYRRFDDGFGRRIETSLLDGALVFHQMLWGETDASLKAAAAVDRRSLLSRARNRIITRAFLCGDGEYIGIHTGAVGAFDRLMEVLGLQDKVKPVTGGFTLGTPLTDEESDAIENSIHGIFASHPREYWVKRLMEADVCAVEHFPPTDAFSQPQTVHNGVIIEVDDPVLGRVRQVGPGIRLDGRAPPTPEPAPAPGRDTAKVLAELDQPAAPSGWAPKAPSGAPDDRPLMEGVKVMDLGAFYAGPFSSRLLADFGADVIKVEPTAGDQLRGIERPFFAAQAGKRSLSANLKSPAVRPAIEALIKWADVVHHNMRPGAAERLGLGLEQVRAINPQAIYLHAPGWGTSGPFAMRQSFAPKMTGYVGLSYEVAGEHNAPLPTSGNEDPGNGLMGAIGLMIALLHRRRTGHAFYCENPQLNAALGLINHIVRNAAGEAVGAGKLDVLQMGVEALESLYMTADGYVCLVVKTDAEIRALEKRLSLKILDDERFATVEARAQNRDDLADLLRDVFDGRTTGEWIDFFAGSGVTVANPVGEDEIHAFFNDPVQRRIGRVAEAWHPVKGNVREIARLVRVSDARLPDYRLAPELGEHSREIMAWLGYAPERIAELEAKGELRATEAAAATIRKEAMAR